MRVVSGVQTRELYTVPEAMARLNLSRTVIYELIRSGRLLTVTQGRRRLVPAESLSRYVDLLISEAREAARDHPA
jgi:excisionase family DNA binding protein